MPRSDFSHSDPWVRVFFTDPWCRTYDDIWHLTFIYVFLNRRLGASSVRFSIYIYMVISLFILCWRFLLVSAMIHYTMPHPIEYEIFWFRFKAIAKSEARVLDGLPKLTTLKAPGLISDFLLEWKDIWKRQDWFRIINIQRNYSKHSNKVIVKTSMLNRYWKIAWNGSKRFYTIYTLTML